jgi:periplasmic divalent cation tolerance protein
VSKLPYRVIFTTCPDSAVAETIARALVEERLAACVNILPAMQSIYTWRSKTETESEHLLIIKATESRYPAIEARIRALHPYELPEIIAVRLADGLPAYLTWLDNPDYTPK